MAPRRPHTLQKRVVFLGTGLKIIFPHLFHKRNETAQSEDLQKDLFPSSPWKGCHVSFQEKLV